MGMLSKYREWLSRPETQMMLGPLAQAFGGPAESLGANMGQAGSYYQEQLERRRQDQEAAEARRRQEERQAQQDEYASQDRARRDTEFDWRRQDRERGQLDRAKTFEGDARRRSGLRDQAFEHGFDPDMVDTDPEGLEKLLLEDYRLTLEPDKPGGWSQVGGGRGVMRTGSDGEVEFQDVPQEYWPREKPEKPDKDALSPGMRNWWHSQGYTDDDELDALNQAGVLPDLAKELKKIGKDAKAPAGRDDRRFTDTTLLSDVNELLSSGNAGNPREAVGEALSRADMLDSALDDRQFGALPTPTEEPTDFMKHLRDIADDPDKVARAVLGESGGLSAGAAATPSATPTPTAIRRQRGGVRTMAPDEAVGRELAGIEIPDPKDTPPGNATLKPVAHGGQRISHQEAQAEASLEMTLAAAQSRLAPQMFQQLQQLVAEARAANHSASEIDQMIAGALGR